MDNTIILTLEALDTTSMIISTPASNSITIPPVTQYKLDIDKIKTIKDIKAILKSMDIYYYFTDEQAEGIKHLLKKVQEDL
jgi:hypothetical protein